MLLIFVNIFSSTVRSSSYPVRLFEPFQVSFHMVVSWTVDTMIWFEISVQIYHTSTHYIV